MTKTVHIAALQQHCYPDKAASLQAIREQTKKACGNGAELVILQELHSTAYFCQIEDTQNFDLAEPIPGPTSSALSEIAKENQCVLVGSIFEKRAAGVYHNTAVIFEKDGELAGTYRKMHIPDDPGFYEKFYFTPGDADGALNGFEPIDTSVGKLGVLICWDQWFPEAARLMALAGADILIYPTAIGWDPKDDQAEKDRQLDAWITSQRAHAIANGLHLVSCNRTGFEAHPSESDWGTQFWGNTFIAGPQGEYFNRAPADGEMIVEAQIDLNKTEATRRIWPYLRDRRVDAYTNLSKRIID